MSQSTYIAAAVIVAFIVFIVSKGSAPKYLALMTGQAGSTPIGDTKVPLGDAAKTAPVSSDSSAFDNIGGHVGDGGGGQMTGGSFDITDPKGGSGDSNIGNKALSLAEGVIGNAVHDALGHAGLAGSVVSGFASGGIGGAVSAGLGGIGGVGGAIGKAVGGFFGGGW